MWGQGMTRRRVLALGGASLAGGLLKGALAQAAEGQVLRVGAVLPARTGATPLEVFSSEIAGESARLGALTAAEEIEALGRRLEVLLASAPDEAAALRAAERLLAMGRVFALIGGASKEQVLALSRLAEARQVPFFNIGSVSDALREACGRYTFHIEASAAMYLDALADAFAPLLPRRWFLVYEDSEEGKARYQRARKALLERHGMEEAGRASVAAETLEFGLEYRAILEARPDVVLLLLNPLAQLNFLGQHDTANSSFQVSGFPDPVTQTRAFWAALHQAAPQLGSGYRVALWEATLDTGGARELNGRFASRWGQPMDPAAWAAYAAVKILFESVLATGGTEASRLVAHLEDPKTVFELHKGVPLSFRPWDHQLRQPLYIVQLNPGVEPGPRLTQQMALVRLTNQLPHTPPGTDPVAWLDQLGDLRPNFRCRP